MTVNFNKNVLPIETPSTTQMLVPENGTYINSVMSVEMPEYIEVEEEHVEEGDVIEEAYGNNIVKKEQVEDLLKKLADSYKIADTNQLEQLANDILKNHETYQGKTIYEMTASDCFRLYLAMDKTLAKSVQNGTFDYETTLENVKTEFGNQIKNSEDNKKRYEIFNKYNEGSFEDYLAENYPNLSREDAIQKYTQEHIFEAIEKRIANGENKEAVLENIKSDIKTIISVLRNDQEKIAFLDVIKNSGSGFVTDLNEFLVQEMNTLTAQEEAAKKATDVENTKDIPEEDITGKFDVADNSRRVIEASDAEVAQKVAKHQAECYDKYCTENKEALDRIKEKLAKGEELTSEEQELLRIHNLHIDTNAGSTVGINNHDLISKQDKDSLTAQIIKLFEKNGDINEISKKIAEIVLSNPEAINNTTLKELTERLDKLTDGKYSQIAAEVKSNLETQNLISGKEVTQKQEDLGFANKKEVDTTNLENYKKEIIAGTERDAVPTISRPNKSVLPSYAPSYKEYVTTYGSFKGFAMYAKEVGVLNAIKEACKNLKNTDKVQVKKAVKRQNTNTQAKLVKSSGVSSIDNLLSWVREDAIKKLEGTILGTTYATKALKEKNEKLQEKASV